MPITNYRSCYRCLEIVSNQRPTLCNRKHIIYPTNESGFRFVYFFCCCSPKAEDENSTNGGLTIRPSTRHLVSFWNCVNETNYMVNQQLWNGKYCCDFISSEVCRSACLNSTSIKNFQSQCRQSDETEFYNCVRYEEIKKLCCKNNNDEDCFKVYTEAFEHKYVDDSILNNIRKCCTERNVSMYECARGHAKETTILNPKGYLRCCSISDKLKCRNSCLENLRTETMDRTIVYNLEHGGCGSPTLHDKFWRCFLQEAESHMDYKQNASQIKEIGMDSAKLHCCHKATSTTCIDLCKRTYSNEWQITWERFLDECIAIPGENNLKYCLNDVDEPCELGTKDLEYCSNFNKQDIYFFRNYSKEADSAAKGDVSIWKTTGHINVSGYQISINNNTECDPLWKALACTFNIKPCRSTKIHDIVICRQNCYEILHKCINWESNLDSISAKTLCMQLDSSWGQQSDEFCISLDSFSETAVELSNHDHDITSPCLENPCRENQACMVNRNCDRRQKDTCSYECVRGCQLGEISNYVVPINTYVRIPSTISDSKICHKICYCSMDGIIEHCQEIPCTKLDSCHVAGSKIDHGTQFSLDCNVCSCFGGDITCTKKQCLIYQLSDSQTDIYSYPCNCLLHYFPVCGRNGQTYHNLCFAKCIGLSENEIAFGTCLSKNPCESNPCSYGAVCVVQRNICLTLLNKPCDQYICVNVRNECGRSPVCDTENREHPNICILLNSGKKLAYMGNCLRNCKAHGRVCGADGNTYQSECAANANFINVDYNGSCKAIGYISGQDRERCLREINCPPLAEKDCRSIVPPGACCPVCAGAFRIFYSQKQIDKIIYTLGTNLTKTFTLKSILKSLERHVHIAECAIRGHLSVENDLLVLVVPTTSRVTKLQITVCIREAEKLVSMVQNSSPRLTSELSLSALTGAVMINDNTNFQNVLTDGSPVINFVYSLIGSSVLLHILRDVI